MSDLYQTFEGQDSTGTKYCLEMLYDLNAESPRDSRDNLGTMLYSHRRYNLGDERLNSGSFEEYLQAQNLSLDQVVHLPVYLYDHSGLALSTEDFGDRWDSGRVGVIFVSHDKIREEFGDVSPETIAKAEQVLRGEVEEMHEYVSGNTFGMRLTTTSVSGEVEQEEVWGFLGSDPRTNGMFDNITEQARQALSASVESQLGKLPSAEPAVAPDSPTRAPRLR